MGPGSIASRICGRDNALNANAVLTLNSNFGAWQRPTLILPARFAKFGVQFDF
jgi:hypothetical protein